MYNDNACLILNLNTQTFVTIAEDAMTTTNEFERHIYQPFQLQFMPMLTLSLTLVLVQKPLSESSAEQTTADDPQLSLIFRGPRQPILLSQQYQLSHSYLGQLQLTLTPYERQESGMLYQAVVSQQHSIATT